MKHERFRYKSLDDIRETAAAAGVRLPISEDTAVLGTRLQTDIPDAGFENRLALQPMEGCDGAADGDPGELTVRRYMRFATSGAGLLWFEATAIVREGRANPRQLMLTESNLDGYKRLISGIKEKSLRENGFAPIVIMQATHSGRYSRPGDKPEPIIACNNPIYERQPISADRIAQDDYLARLPEKYAAAAKLAEEAGFDGVDVKACHRYLINELLSARTRENSRYGGSLENRSRLYLEAIAAVRAVVSNKMLVTSRLNAYDGIEYPYGFGVAEDGGLAVELSEPIALVKRLAAEQGLRLLNITIGNPYFNPHVNRPYDNGFYEPPEHPFEGLGRMYACIAEIKSACPEMLLVASGMSYTRQFSPYIAAGLIESGAVELVGYGREAFAYPGFAGDILRKNAMDAKLVCICCGKCTELMRAGSTAGCAVRDEVYRDIYKRDVNKS